MVMRPVVASAITFIAAAALAGPVSGAPSSPPDSAAQHSTQVRRADGTVHVDLSSDGTSAKGGNQAGRKPKPSPSATRPPAPSPSASPSMPPSPSPSATGSGPDPQLEPGWPAYGFSSSGTYQGGPDMNVLVGDIDGDPEQEIIVSATATGPVYAFDPDGVPVQGWPLRQGAGAGYAALGDLTPGDGRGFDVAVTYWGGGSTTYARAAAVRGDGTPVPGLWPQWKGGTSTVRRSPVVTDLNGDGQDEVLVDLQGEAYAVDHHGEPVQWWQPPMRVGASIADPSVADLNGDGRKEVVVAGRSLSDIEVSTRQLDGTELPGFPMLLPNEGELSDVISIGDVTGDGRPDLVLATAEQYSGAALVHVIDPRTASVVATMRTVSTVAYHAEPALADLDGDGVLDIVVQSDKGLDVWRGNGTALPGFPIPVGDQVYGSKAEGDPVVGDVTGDGRPDIVLVAKGAEANTGRLYAFDAAGHSLPGFPKTADGGLSSMPAIADIDNDGRNEIIAAGMRIDLVQQEPMVWVWDLGGPPSGRIYWGQHKGGPRHEGVAGAATTPPAPPSGAGTLSGPAVLTADIAAGTAGSQPRDIVPFGSGVAFTAWRPDVGREVFVSDGTPSGTRLVADVLPGVRGSGARELTVAGGVLYFVADNGSSGAELWRSDGTAVGTRMVRDVWPGAPGSRPEWLTALGGQVAFSADDGSTGRELWRSDGTSAGTERVADFKPGRLGGEPKDLATVDGVLYFQAYGQWIDSTGYVIGDQYMYSLDSAGNLQRDDQVFAPGAEPVYDVFAWYPPLFTDGDRLWQTSSTVVSLACGTADDGSDEAIGSALLTGGVRLSGARGLDRDCTTPLVAWTSTPPRPAPRDLVSWSGTAWFSASDATSGRELWRSDGTPDGSRLAADIRAGTGDSDPQLLTPDGTRLLFTADGDNAGRELWAIGTTGNATRLTDLWPGPGGGGIRDLTRTSAGWFFVADNPDSGTELWTMPAG
jgi:ELWxxDGT repeat protein